MPGFGIPCKLLHLDVLTDVEDGADELGPVPDLLPAVRAGHGDLLLPAGVVVLAGALDGVGEDLVLECGLALAGSPSIISSEIQCFSAIPRKVYMFP